MNEIWKTIPDTNNLYMISNLGRVKRIKYIQFKVKFGRSWRIITRNKGYVNPHNHGGYLSVNMVICKGVWLRSTIHKLVLEAFVGPCPNGMQCRHLDDDKTNNCIKNLCWGTQSENDRDAYKNGVNVPKRGFESKNCVVTRKNAQRIKKLYRKNKISQKKLGEKFGISQMTVCNVLREKYY